MANYKREKAILFSNILYIINQYDRYRNGDASVDIDDLQERARSLNVKSLNLKVDGSRKEFLDSLEKSYQAVRGNR